MNESCQLSPGLQELVKQADIRTKKDRARHFAQNANVEQHLVALINQVDAVMAEFRKLSAAARRHEKMMPLSIALFDLRGQAEIARKRKGAR